MNLYGQDEDRYHELEEINIIGQGPKLAKPLILLGLLAAYLVFFSKGRR